MRVNSLDFWILGGDREGPRVRYAYPNSEAAVRYADRRNVHVAARGDVGGEVTDDATNEKRPRVAASWAICGVGRLRLGGELAALGLLEPGVFALGVDLA